MAKKIKWGILACGGIAQTFANDLALSRKCELVAVASRTQRKANNFAKGFSNVRPYGCYQALVEDPEVDVVYVASLHPQHYENTLLALNAGKPVLCEKPIALNARQTQGMVKAARKNDVFLMEAMWTRFFPAIIRLRKWLTEGRIGEVQAMQADFGVNFPYDPGHRIYDPMQGGGALLDLGIYPISLASMVMGGPPRNIQSHAHFSKTGVDDQESILFQYDEGFTAQLFASCLVTTRFELRIYGTKGHIAINGQFFNPDHLILQMEGKKPRLYPFRYEGTGMYFEADHVADCLRRGKKESDLMPLAESVTIMKTLDRIRRRWKLVYPGE